MNITDLSTIELRAAIAAGEVSAVEAAGAYLSAIEATESKLASFNEVLADDVPHESLTAQRALANAPQRDGDFFKVPKVIGESQ